MPLHLSLHGHNVPLWWVVGGAAVALASAPLFLAAAFASRLKTKPNRHRTVTILVLGDIGRSPRMMYHAESFARSGWHTFLIGYGGEFCIAATAPRKLVRQRSGFGAGSGSAWLAPPVLAIAISMTRQHYAADTQTLRPFPR